MLWSYGHKLIVRRGGYEGRAGDVVGGRAAAALFEESRVPELAEFRACGENLAAGELAQMAECLIHGRRKRLVGDDPVLVFIGEGFERPFAGQQGDEPAVRIAGKGGAQ